MLKSTHKPLAAGPPLPPGWTEHKAPTGHPYYYNSSTKESTYHRPTVPALLQEQPAIQAPVVEGNNVYSRELDFRACSVWTGTHIQPPSSRGAFDAGRAFAAGRGGVGGEHRSQNQRRPTPEDRPKSKQLIPGCSPWLLVKTKLGRRFVYNPEEGQSYWKFPPDVMRCVVECDRLEREKRERKERGETSEPERKDGDEAAVSGNVIQTTESAPEEVQPFNGTRHEDDSDEYEEVEVTDDGGDDYPSKRQRTEEKVEDGPVEFDEDDIAYQLAAMGQDYGLDPGEYGEDVDGSWEEGADGLPLTEEDSKALFMDMLKDHHINPYTPWENIVEEGKIIEDDRYTCLPNMKSRKEIWGEWTRDRIQQLKEQRERQEKKDPRIPYFAFLQNNATPKLYWPEFRRKYKKEPEMRDTKVSDKDREKWYREFINRLKLPESTLKSGLSAALKALPLHALNRSTSLQALPPALLTDIRYISLRPQIRDPLIEAFISIAPPAPASSDISPEEEADLAKEKKERERREKALAERDRKVQEEKKRQRLALQHSKGMLREGEEEIERAMHVGREGLLRHMVSKHPSTTSEIGAEVNASSEQ